MGSRKHLIIVTGSSGLIGSSFIERLSSEYQLAALDIEPPEDKSIRECWLECDLTDDSSVAAAFDEIGRRYGRHAASVVHLAAYYDFSGKPSPLYNKLTVQGTGRVLHALQRFRVEQFIFSSSLLVMKPLSDADEVLDESSETQAKWPYPQSKIDAEQKILSMHGDIPVVIHRFAGVYTDRCHSIPISQQIRRIYERRLESFVFPGDTGHGQAFIHLDDAVDCLLRTIEKRSELDQVETFLTAEEDVMSYRELQEDLGTLLHGKGWTTIRIPKTAARAGAWVKEKLPFADPFIKSWMVGLADDHYRIAADRLGEKLGWAPARSLRETLPKMTAALKEDPRGWYQEHDLPLPDFLEVPPADEQRTSNAL